MQGATALSITVAGGLAIAVIALKYDVANLEDDLARVNRAILNEQRAIHVLQAEWTHLNDPARLETLATQVLAMRRVDPASMRPFSDLPLQGSDLPDQTPAARQPPSAPPIARLPEPRNRPDAALAAAAPLPLDDSAVPADELSVVLPPPVEDPPAEPARRNVGG